MSFRGKWRKQSMINLDLVQARVRNIHLEYKMKRENVAIPEIHTKDFDEIEEHIDEIEQEKEEKQIAELLRVSVNTVKTQKQRAKAYLKGRLGELFVYMTLFFFEF